MTHADFIYPSYALTVAGLIGAVTWSFVAMRRAEGTPDQALRRAEAAAAKESRR